MTYTTGCVADATSLCPHDSRFRVKATWRIADGRTGDVRVDLEVLDTDHEAGKTYVNPLGHPFTPILDSNAFATCP